MHCPVQPRRQGHVMQAQAQTLCQLMQLFASKQSNCFMEVQWRLICSSSRLVCRQDCKLTQSHTHTCYMWVQVLCVHDAVRAKCYVINDCQHRWDLQCTQTAEMHTATVKICDINVSAQWVMPCGSLPLSFFKLMVEGTV